MLPPSPHGSQAQHHPPVRAPASNSFSNGRELPALSSTHRPSSSMSISSMLESNPAKSSLDEIPNGNSNAAASAATGFVTSPKLQQNQAGQSNSLLGDRSISPEKHKVHQTLSGRPFRSYSSGLGQRPPSFTHPTSPQTTRNGPLSGSQTSEHSPSSGPALHQGWHFPEGRRLPDGRVVHRPSSQPTGHYSPPQKTNGNSLLRQSDHLHQQLDARRSYMELHNEDNFEKLRADRPYFNEQSQQQAFRGSEAESLPPREHPGPKQERINGSELPLASHPAEDSNSKPIKGAEVVRPAVTLGCEKDSQSLQSAQSPFSPESLRRLQKERHIFQQRGTTHSPLKYPRKAAANDDGRPLINAENSTPFPDAMDLSREVEGIDHHHFRDDTNGHRKSSLVMLIEGNRRGGRFSPLPQAVQGAQGRTSGPASDPGIKNEFARMFSGIGSGVGSAGPTGSGTSTPFAPPSPTMSHEQRQTPFKPRSEVGNAKPITTSRGGKRSRKVRDDDTKAELMDNEATGPTGAGPKAVKRSRNNYHHSHHTHQ